MEFIVFTDESSISGSRYPSISAFSIPYGSFNYMTERYQHILRELEISEFKWNKLRNNNYYECAKRIVDVLFKYLYEDQLRIDVVIWDTYDSRHNIKRRDDISNFERMFFHLLKISLKKREHGSIYHIRPDERGGIDWETIKDCLNGIGRKRHSERTLFGELFSDPSFTIKSFVEKDSKKEILIQIPDLFSGMASYSKYYYQEYREWKKQNFEQEQLSLFETQKDELTSRKIYCSKILDYFYEKCKLNKMSVSLQSNKCLYSYKPHKPINFWHYQPQGDYDKAPTKKKKL